MKLFEETEEIDKLDITVKKIIRMSNQLAENIESQHTQIFNTIWNSRLGLSPQEILDKLQELVGVEGLEKLFKASREIQEYLKSQDDDYNILVPGYDYELTENGVVVGEKHE